MAIAVARSFRCGTVGGLLTPRPSQCRCLCWVPQRDTLSYLRDARANREVYLIGTAHISQRSAEEVGDLIRLVRPAHVAVELCPQRKARLQADAQQHDQMSALLRSFGGNESDAMLRAAFQALNGLWKQYGLVPGVDFKAALDAADAIGASVHCIDRDVDETLRLLRGALGEVDLARFMTTLPPKELMAGMLRGGSIGDVVESLKDRAQVAALRRHLNRAAPSIVEVMLHQRDRLMVKQLRRQVPQGVVVAVVGLAHMDGIEHEWLLQDDLQTGHS